MLKTPNNIIININKTTTVSSVITHCILYKTDFLKLAFSYKDTNTSVSSNVVQQSMHYTPTLKQ